jgi:hypothetical protein
MELLKQTSNAHYSSNLWRKFLVQKDSLENECVDGRANIIFSDWLFRWS